MNSPAITMLDQGFKLIQTFEGGGMGLVHRAHHLTWNIEVAIKHPRAKYLLSQEQIDEFQEECTKWENIGLHPYVATCYYTKFMDSLPCVVAEFVAGGSLQDAIDNRSLYSGEEEECLARMLTIAASTARGLARSHDEELLHRDVKPGNMLLTSHGIGKISDFGLAISFQTFSPDPNAGIMTQVFASPEQLRRLPLTPATDVWSWAASMLSMFAGEIFWITGSACEAALQQFVAHGAKAYRIPAMPEKFAELLQSCFQYSPNARPQAFREIADTVANLYREIFGETCPVQEPDSELNSAASLNNRAVSKHELQQHSEVHRFLKEAFAIDPLHPEANFNAAWLNWLATGKISPVAIRNLEFVAHYDLGDYRPDLYRACLLQLSGKESEATEAFHRSSQLSTEAESAEIQRLRNLSISQDLHPILSPPISGEDTAYDRERFNRLIKKASDALSEQRQDDAERYLTMCGDIPAFARHPKRRKLLQKFSN